MWASRITFHASRFPQHQSLHNTQLWPVSPPCHYVTCCVMVLVMSGLVNPCGHHVSRFTHHVSRNTNLCTTLSQAGVPTHSAVAGVPTVPHVSDTTSNPISSIHRRVRHSPVKRAAAPMRAGGSRYRPSSNFSGCSSCSMTTFMKRWASAPSLTRWSKARITGSINRGTKS